MERPSRERKSRVRWLHSGGARKAAVFTAGVLVGALMVSPGAAHITSSVSHTVKHMKKIFFTKAQSDRRYVRTACPEGMVKAGSVCIDRYEASVWSHPNGGTQYGVSSDDYPCNDHGQDCVGKIYARSVAGVTPSRYITWFQAQQALANSGKRLPSNAEWQMAVAGTPDSMACNINTGSVQNTGANVGCISNFGANDMVGNLGEWIADWLPRATGTGSWSFSNDRQGISGAATTGEPGALIRGGSFDSGTDPGPFGVFAGFGPSYPGDPGLGFRGAR